MASGRERVDREGAHDKLPALAAPAVSESTRQMPASRASRSASQTSQAVAMHEYQEHEDAEKGVQKNSIVKEESTALQPKARKKFLCWSLSKSKWIAAIIACVLSVLLVVLLVVFLAVVPAIFQQQIDNIDMQINYMDIKTLPMDADGRNVDIELSLRVAYTSSVSASMNDAAATLLYNKRPFGTVTLPAQHFTKRDGAFDLVIRNAAEITDPAVFRELSKALVTDEQVTIDTRAEIKATAMGLSYGGLHLDRSFPIKAFANFNDPPPVVNQITLAECSSSAYKLVVNATLDNDSQVGIGGVGALNLSVYHEQNYLGQAVSTNTNLGLPRGPMDLALELTIVKGVKTTAALVGMVGSLLGTSGVRMFIRGDHPHAIEAPLLDEAFAALNISVLYKDGLRKVTFNPRCDLAAILTGTG